MDYHILIKIPIEFNLRVQIYEKVIELKFTPDCDSAIMKTLKVGIILFFSVKENFQVNSLSINVCHKSNALLLIKTFTITKIISLLVHALYIAQ